MNVVGVMLEESRSNLLLIREDLHEDQIITLEIQRAAWYISVEFWAKESALLN